jgi:hypothetical protein
MGPKRSIFNLIINFFYRLRHAFSKICYVTQNMARSSSNKQSTSAPPADAVARCLPRATVADKLPRVVLSPRSRAAFEQRREPHHAHVAAVNAHLAREKANQTGKKNIQSTRKSGPKTATKSSKE